MKKRDPIRDVAFGQMTSMQAKIGETLEGKDFQIMCLPTAEGGNKWAWFHRYRDQQDRYVSPTGRIMNYNQFHRIRD